MKKRLIFALSAMLLCYALFLFLCPLYYSSDSLMAALVVDGFFGDNNLSQFQHPLLCLIARIVTLALPSADAFTVLLHLTCAAGFFATAYYGLAPVAQRPIKSWRIDDYLYIAILALLIVFLSAGIGIWNNNYTITAGAFAFMGLMLFLPGPATRWQRAAAVSMIAMGIMLRRESAMLFLPFIGLDLVVSVMEQPTARRRLLRRYLPVLLTFALLLGSRAVVYAFEPYATAARYNAARTAIMDYPMKGEAGAGIDPVDYRAAVDWWAFADTDNMDLDALERIADAGSGNAYSLSAEGLSAVVSQMKRDLFHTNLYMSIMIIALALLLLRNLICCAPWRRAECAIAVIGAFVIIAYFTFRGRAPMRVWEPVLMAVGAAQIRAATAARPARTNARGTGGAAWRSTVNSVALLAIAVTLWFSAGQVIAYAVPNAAIHTALTARAGEDDSVYRDDTLYIWPNWHGTIPSYFEKEGRLPSRRVIDHNIALGDWTYGQPYYTEFLSRIGAENPIQRLVDGEALIMGNGIEGYLRKHYGDDIRLVPTDIIIDDKAAYKVERETRTGESDDNGRI